MRNRPLHILDARSLIPTNNVPLPLPKASQLRLNDELDAGTHAVFSDVESCLRPRAVRPGSTNTNGPRTTDAMVGAARGVSRKGTVSHRAPYASGTAATRGIGSGGISRAAQIMSTSTHGGAQTAPEAEALLAGREDAAARSAGGRGGVEGGGGVSVERGGVWGGDLWFDRDGVKGETGGRGLGARAGAGVGLGAGAGGLGNGAATSSPLFKVSERLRGAARASGERNRRRAAGASQSPPSGDEERMVRDVRGRGGS